MSQVTIHHAKTHLSRLIQDALAGEEVVIAKGSHPLVRLVPVARPPQPRKIGSAPDLVLEMADDFDEPLADFDPYGP